MKRNNTVMIKSKMVGVALVAAVIGLNTSNQAKAQTGFGTIPGVSGSNPYSGSGIPFNTSEYNVINGVPGDTLTLALAATQYKSNPAPGNNGAGTYTVSPGPGVVGTRSTWDFDFYVNSSQNELSDYTFLLVETGNGHTFSFNPGVIADNVGAPASMGNSESLDFASFGVPIGYNQNQNDTYGFQLEAFLGGNEIGSDSITVIDGTGSVPDSASTGLFLGLGFAGLMLFSFKQNRLIAAK
jgi:hypothetical protein